MKLGWSKNRQVSNAYKPYVSDKSRKNWKNETSLVKGHFSENILLSNVYRQNSTVGFG